MSESKKIPKIIHYCWFGKKPLPEMAIKCIDSWKKYCPDYEIMEWNENNFNLEMNDYVKEAYVAKKWAFVSDVARLYALVNYGGIYMDTDVEVIKPLDDLLDYTAFLGFESDSCISTAFMASEKNHRMFIEFLQDYEHTHFKREDGSLDLTTNVTRITNTCLKYGLKQNNQFQNIKGFTVLPKDYLCPKNYETKEINITKNTYTIHHFDGSWHSQEDIYYEKLKRRLCFIGGSYVAKCVSIVKFRGLESAIKESIGWIKRK